MNSNQSKKIVDKNLLLLVLGFIVFGLVMIGDVSLIQGEVVFHDKFYFLRHQFQWALIGIIVMIITSKIDYRFWGKISKFAYVGSLIALVLVFLPIIGVKAYGASRWINIGFMNFQPVELAKITLILYFAQILTAKERRPFGHQIVLLGIPALLVILQPDFGSMVLLVCPILMMLFIANEKVGKLFLFGILAITMALILIFSSPYRKQRVLGLLDPFYDPQGKSYHVYQIALTLGSGGWFGTGMGNSRQKYQYVPEATTDSIIALVAEELGFFGICIVIFSFGYFIFRVFKNVTTVSDSFGRLVGIGLAASIGTQGLVNLAAVAIFIPLTGVPFPFISYGGSSLISILAATGIILNIGKSAKTLEKK
jgi:cell division protein FtsW